MVFPWFSYGLGYPHGYGAPGVSLRRHEDGPAVAQHLRCSLRLDAPGGHRGGLHGSCVGEPQLLPGARGLGHGWMGRQLIMMVVRTYDNMTMIYNMMMISGHNKMMFHI